MTFHRVLEVASQSDIGLVRTHNEDALVVSAENGILVLADGMGGYNAGEVASQMSVDIVSRHLLSKKETTWLPRLAWQTSIPAKWINDAIVDANSKVITLANQNPENYGMGTTIVAAFCYFDKLVIGHVGDSRAYRFRRDQLTQITHDHSVLQTQIDAGLISEADAHFSPIKNLITRAVGSHDEIEVEIHDHLMEVGDVYLLCSDGLTDMLDRGQIQLALQQHSADLHNCCQMLVALANAQGGLDNISVVLCRVKELQERSLIEYIFTS